MLEECESAFLGLMRFNLVFENDLRLFKMVDRYLFVISCKRYKGESNANPQYKLGIGRKLKALIHKHIATFSIVLMGFIVDYEADNKAEMP